MAVFQTTSPIAATAETVWGILVDFDRWSEWNPSVPSISGDARVGSTLAMALAMPRRPSAKVKAEITELDPERRFSWHAPERGPQGARRGHGVTHASSRLRELQLLGGDVSS